jgi:hypothetical protein
MITVISESDATKLRQLEKVVEKGKRAFIEVGNALREIRDSKLYKATHGTFAAYVEERFSFKRAYAYQLIETADAIPKVSTTVDIANQRQAREIAKAPPEHQQEVVDRAVEIAEERGKKPTAAIIAEARKEVVAEFVPEDIGPDEIDEYEDVEDDELPVRNEPKNLVSFSVCRNEFRVADNRMSFVREVIAELEEHELALLKEWLNE